MNTVITELKNRRDEAKLGGGQRRIDSQHAKGKLTARERLELLLDPGSFEEFDMFVTHRSTDFGMEKKKNGGRRRRHGLGDNQWPQDICVRAGFYGLWRLALGNSRSKNHKSAGNGDAPRRADYRSARFGRSAYPRGCRGAGGLYHVFQNNILASGVIPQISVIMGPSAGGAKTHTSKSSVADGAYDNDMQALSEIRRLFDFLPLNNRSGVPTRPFYDAHDRIDESLDTLVPDNPNLPYDMKELVHKIADEGDFFEIQADFAKNILCGFIRLEGQTVGVVANQPMVLAGCLDSDASRKAARFVRFCDCFDIPILTLVDVPGFLPGTDQEYGGLIKHGAKLLYAFGEATVPKVTVITRKAYGGAYCVMAPKHLRGDINYAWPSAQIAVMGAKGAVEILHRTRVASSKPRGRWA